MDPPREKREPGRFEPPPWERERFEELKKRRDRDRAAREEADTAFRARTVTEKPNGAEMDTMIFDLFAEEKSEHGLNTFVVGMAVAVFIGFLGAVFMSYAMIVAARLQGAGMAAIGGSAIIGMMGLMLLVSAVWLGVRTRNTRGV